MNEDSLLFVGTANDQGILVFDWNPAAGELGRGRVAAVTRRPPWIALDPGRERLYAVNGIKGGEMGSVTAFDRHGDRLVERNRVSSAGLEPCHVVLDHTGRTAIIANYAGGSAASFRIAADGSLSEAVSIETYAGSGPVPGRQDKPHAHHAVVSPDNRFVYVNDLGTDRIHIYRLDAATARLTPLPAWEADPGTGPRTLTFHPRAKVAYNINELSSTVDVLEWDPGTGALARIQKLSLLPEGYAGPTRGCDTAIPASGDFAYFANRDHEFLATCGCDPASGRLTLLDRMPAAGREARHLTLDRSGHWLIVAYQFSNELRVLERDARTGALRETGQSHPVEVPACLMFA